MPTYVGRWIVHGGSGGDHPDEHTARAHARDIAAREGYAAAVPAGTPASLTGTPDDDPPVSYYLWTRGPNAAWVKVSNTTYGSVGSALAASLGQLGQFVAAPVAFTPQANENAQLYRLG